MSESSPVKVPDQDSAATAARRLGLPETGPLSLAPLGRRVIALLVDWVIALGVVRLLGLVRDLTPGMESMLPLLVFGVLTWLSVSVVGSTIGHYLLGLQVVAIGRPTLSPIAVAIRTVLLCLVIPAVVWDGDGRGLHDRLAGTAIVRR